nr:MAG TPA: hypothetical protein [Caudoviricetes sp.]
MLDNAPYKVYYNTCKGNLLKGKRKEKKNGRYECRRVT